MIILISQLLAKWNRVSLNYKMDIGDLVTTINILVNAKYSKIVKVAGKLEIRHVNKDI